jgi:hypothetical protein
LVVSRCHISRNLRENRGRPIEPLGKRRYRLLPISRQRLVPGHQVRPHRHVEDDVLERGAHRAVADVEPAVQLVVGQFLAAQEELPRRPSIVLQ